ncbi:uncharacterized protein LOC106057964 [Biomphalaria glabrata]|uniref:Uncharacterized protein LOC106057964 n=1 Tax=Biomphalaria glabrata TaxID=6526 RepID=A0A9W2ZWY5_BIOGL|nr:uncharacterized protein LOC106057964 [Biomphalaria glabrata]
MGSPLAECLPCCVRGLTHPSDKTVYTVLIQAGERELLFTFADLELPRAEGSTLPDSLKRRNVTSLYCKKCATTGKILKKNPAKYATWFAHHQENGCTINYDGTSGMMESEAAVKIWQISLALLNFRNYYWRKKTWQSHHRKNQNSQQILWGAVRSNRTAEEMKKAILASLYHNYSI